MKASSLRKVLVAGVLFAGIAQTALAASVSISVHQPGVWGRVTLG